MEGKEGRRSRTEQDRELIFAVRNGDDKAFEKLVTRYRKSVYYLIFKMVRNAEDAEDITQDTFVKAYNSIARFDPKFAFSTWLFKIATNNCIDFIRRKRLPTTSINAGSQSESGVEVFVQLIDTNLIPYERILREQRKEYLTTAIERLPDRYQQLIQLRYFEELSYEEVAETLQIPLGTVKAQLHRARELLNNALAESMNSL